MLQESGFNFCLVNKQAMADDLFLNEFDHATAVSNLVGTVHCLPSYSDDLLTLLLSALNPQAGK